VPRGVVDGWRWGWGLRARDGGRGSEVSISAMCCRVGKRMNVGVVCYSCLVGAKRMGGTSRLFWVLWINFDCAIALSPGQRERVTVKLT